ncbi:MAG: DNA polymerase/3'-5' exonuclease PolX [Spirochaetia bacterium]
MNRKIADLFREVADALEIKGVQWKPRAYRKAARTIQSLEKSLDRIYEKEGKKGLKEIPGIGDSIADHIAQYIQTGEVEEFTEHLQGVSKGQNKLLDIEGIGPKTVNTLAKELGIQSIEDLEDAVKNEKIRALEGFGKKTEEKMKESLSNYKANKGRMLLGKALPIAEDMVASLQKNTPVDRIEYAGSLRRMKETIGDLDILAVSKEPEKVMDYFTSQKNVDRVLNKGETKSSVVTDQGLQIDLRVIQKEHWGAAELYFTGSKDHNVALRKAAGDQGFKLSEYGLEDSDSGKLQTFDSEKGVYEKLGYSFIPPQLRENRGELEAAKNGSLPDLIRVEDVKGDLQMHTNYSDGQESIQKMAEAAEQMGYEYIAITDHSKATRIANGMDEKALRKQIAEIESLHSGIKIIKSAEVEILKDGSLDYPDELLKELDMVLVTIHSGFLSSEKEMTKRILKAFENKYVNIFGHPTGRKIGTRKAYQYDFVKIAKEAADKHIALEINCSPERLDLNDQLILKAKEQNVKFSLGTDSHISSNLDTVRFGVGQAQRGWLEAGDVINTYSYKKLTSFFSN